MLLKVYKRCQLIEVVVWSRGRNSRCITQKIDEEQYVLGELGEGDKLYKMILIIHLFNRDRDIIIEI